jgi:hypothetical protein
MSKKVLEIRAETLALKMKELNIGKEDVKDINDVDFKVEERLIQVIGHFYKYDSILDKNVLVKEGVFLVIDKINRPGQSNFGGHYIINVIDPTQTISYTRCEITSDRLLEFVTKDFTLMWLGDIRPSGEIPAWCFYITQGSEVVNQVKGVLTKCLVETNTREQAESDSVSEKGNDRQWLEAAMLGGGIDEEMLNGSEILSDFGEEEAFGSFDD